MPPPADMRERLLPEAEHLLNDERVSAWVLVWQHRGLEHTLEKMSTYYSNLGLVAALLGTLSANVALDPPGTINEGWTHGAQGLAGMLGFAAAIGTIIDCVLIANTCSLTASGRQFLHFLRGQAAFLQVPTWLFIATCVLTGLQMVIVAMEVYEGVSVSIPECLAHMMLFLAARLLLTHGSGDRYLPS